MKVFISWSGDLSRELGKCFDEWLPATLQAVKTYYSPEAIEKGAHWSSKLAKELEESGTGLFILTPDNLTAPWMMFEAGAISKQFGEASVCSILFGVNASDVTPPLSLYQMTKFEKADVKRLITTINQKCGDAKLFDGVLDTVFEKWWPDLESRVDAVMKSDENTLTQEPRPERELLEEILLLTRSIADGGQLRRPFFSVPEPDPDSEYLATLLKNEGGRHTAELESLIRQLTDLASVRPDCVLWKPNATTPKKCE